MAQMMGLWKSNWLWVTLVGVHTGILLICYQLGGLGLVSKVAVYLGMGYLVLTLLPNNIIGLHLQITTRFFPLLSLLARYKRNLGITSGLLFLTHGYVNIFRYSTKLFDTTLWFSKPIILGILAISIFELMLLTSSAYAMRVLKSRWKRLHRLVWLAVPAALFHSMLASYWYEGIITKTGITGFGLITLFVGVEFIFFVVQHQPPAIRWKHITLTVIGLLISVAVVFFYPD